MVPNSRKYAHEFCGHPGRGFSRGGRVSLPAAAALARSRSRALFYRKLLGRPFLSDRSPGRWRYFSKTAQTRLAGYQGWICAGASFLAFWPNTPGQWRAFWTDATFRQFVDFGLRTWPPRDVSARVATNWSAVPCTMQICVFILPDGRPIPQ
jgi:hypothetical protein